MDNPLLARSCTTVVRLEKLTVEKFRHQPVNTLSLAKNGSMVDAQRTSLACSARTSIRAHKDEMSLGRAGLHLIVPLAVPAALMLAERCPACSCAHRHGLATSILAFTTPVPRRDARKLGERALARKGKNLSYARGRWSLSTGDCDGDRRLTYHRICPLARYRCGRCDGIAQADSRAFSVEFMLTRHAAPRW